MINLIAAVGRSGQIGLNERLPWTRHDDDMQWFYQLTRGGSVIMGGRTARALNWHDEQVLSGGRIVFHYRGGDPVTTLNRCKHFKPHAPIWICGGAHTYKLFMPYVERSYIANMDYAGEADTIMPPLWNTP